MKPYILFALISLIVLPLIEFVRYKIEYGRNVNLDKTGTVAIAIASFFFLCWTLVPFEWAVLFFALSCIGIRGIFYDPALNILMKRKINDESTSTNSKVDGIEQDLNVPFWKQRLIYLALALVAAFFYEWLKR